MTHRLFSGLDHKANAQIYRRLWHDVFLILFVQENSASAKPWISNLQDAAKVGISYGGTDVKSTRYLNVEGVTVHVVSGRKIGSCGSMLTALEFFHWDPPF